MKITKLNYSVESEGRADEEILGTIQRTIEEEIEWRRDITKDQIKVGMASPIKLRGELVETVIVVQLAIPVALEIWREIILPKLKKKLNIKEKKKTTKSL